MKLPAELIRQAKLEERRACADLVDKLSDKIMRAAERVHKKAEHEPQLYDEYERLEGAACFVSSIARKIRRRRDPATHR